MNEGTVATRCTRLLSLMSKKFSKIGPCLVERTKLPMAEIHLIYPFGLESLSHVTA